MKIYAPVKSANGVWCTVRFRNGVGETDNPHLIKWFKEHGYRVDDTKSHEVTQVVEEPTVEPVEVPQNEKPYFANMTPNELRDWMKANGLGREMKNIRNKEKLIEIINDKKGW